MVGGLFYTLPSIPGLTLGFVLILNSSHNILRDSSIMIEKASIFVSFRLFAFTSEYCFRLIKDSNNENINIKHDEFLLFHHLLGELHNDDLTTLSKSF